MARFHFPLERVLELRQREEGAKQRIVADYEQERLALEAQLRNCQSIIEDEKQAWSRAVDPSAGRGVDLSSVRFQAGASLRAVGEAQRVALQLAGVMKRVARAREELARAAAKRRAVELLKERALESWERAQRQQEAAELDDLVIMRHGRDDFPLSAPSASQTTSTTQRFSPRGASGSEVA